jgi:hypothetical protein
MSTDSRLPKSTHPQNENPASKSTARGTSKQRPKALSIMTTKVFPLPSYHQSNIKDGDEFTSSASESNDSDTPTLAQTIPARPEKQTDRPSQIPALKLNDYADADADGSQRIVTPASPKSYVCLPHLDLTTPQYASWQGENFDGPEWTEENAKIEEDLNLVTIIGICHWVAICFAEDFPAAGGDRVSSNRDALGPARCKVLRNSMLRTVHRILYFQPTWDEFLEDDEHFEIFLQTCRDLQPAYMLEGIAKPLGSLGIYI